VDTFSADVTEVTVSNKRLQWKRPAPKTSRPAWMEVAQKIGKAIQKRNRRDKETLQERERAT
jgi:hypothetical protein